MLSTVNAMCAELEMQLARCSEVGCSVLLSAKRCTLSRCLFYISRLLLENPSGSRKRWAGILWDAICVSNLRVPGCRTAVWYIEGTLSSP